MGFIVLNVIIKLLIRMGKNLGMKCSLSLLDFKQQNYEINYHNQYYKKWSGFIEKYYWNKKGNWSFARDGLFSEVLFNKQLIILLEHTFYGYCLKSYYCFAK